MSDNLQIIVKLAERCNLNCNYCYMYTGLDQSWRQRPAFLSPEHRAQLVDHAALYLAESPSTSVTLEFHGGEPLLLGKQAATHHFRSIRERLPVERTHLCLQTNGTLLDDDWCDIFEEYAVSWSISCDGPPEIHDRYRLYHNGRPSSAKVEQAIELSLARQTALFGGVLSVIDPATDGARIVRYFHDLGLANLDLLMPDSNYLSTPHHLQGFSDEAHLTFLVDAFDQWVSYQDGQLGIRLFEHMIRGLYGLRSDLDAFGGNLWGMMVVESDGSYQLLDVLRIGGSAEVATGLGLQTDTFAAYLAQTEGIFPDACTTCQECPAFRVCGGGYLPHRYNGVDYDRPSVHCSVLYRLIEHIYAYLRRVTPDRMWEPQSSSPKRVTTVAEVDTVGSQTLNAW